MDHPTHARSSEAELRIALNPEKNMARWAGTWQQLVQEGVIPADKEPSLDARGSRWWSTGDMNYSIRHVPGSDAPAVFEVKTFYLSSNQRARAIKQKLAELSTLVHPCSTDRIEHIRAHGKARQDRAFQEFKRNLLGQKRRGRKPVNANGAAT